MAIFDKNGIQVGGVKITSYELKVNVYGFIRSFYTLSETKKYLKALGLQWIEEV